MFIVCHNAREELGSSLEGWVCRCRTTGPRVWETLMGHPGDLVMDGSLMGLDVSGVKLVKGWEL